jgi:hypothetical protein
MSTFPSPNSVAVWLCLAVPIGISNSVFEGRRTLTGHIGTVLMASVQPAGAGFAAVSGS